MNLLLERGEFFSSLANDLGVAASGKGRVVLVCGEAGVGKTTLIEHFVTRHPKARYLMGGCEALLTPHPLGPLHDIARDAGQSGEHLKNLLATNSDRGVLFGAVLDELSAPPSPVVLVIEDIHWADAATMDLIKYLGRRIARVPALLVLSYRDDEITTIHPLRSVLGQLPERHITRIALSPLSEAAVETMARTANRSSFGLFATTSGNPFFVTEVLANPENFVPATIRDAVLARAAQLPSLAREVLEFAALSPRDVDMGLLDALVPSSLTGVERCINCGLLIAEGRMLRFRHELARAAIETSIAPPRVAAMHQQILSVLSMARQRPPLARLVHHAFHAGDAAAVLRYAPQAAHEAEIRGARQEAAAQCRAALFYESHMDDAERADLLENYARHCFELNDIATAISAREQAITLFEKLDNPEQQADCLAGYALSLVRSLRNDDADAASQRAISLAESLPEGRVRARVYTAEAILRMLNRDCHESIDWGNKALELAQQFGETITLASAYNTVGAALLFIDYERGRETVLTSLRIAGGLRDGGVGVAEAYSMLGSGAGELFDFATAQRYLTEGLAFAIQHDLDRMAGYMEAWIALIDTYRGNWDAAGDRATSLLPRLQPGSTNRITALIALIRLRIRRGDPGVTELLEEASVLGHRSGTLQRLAPVCALSAEHAWMTNDVERVIKETDPAFRLAIQKRHPWFVGELAYWRWKAGEPVDPATVTIVARPYALQFTGNWREAGDAWMALDCPHEAARAYMDGDHEAQLHALDIFMRLTAKPMIERLRGAMLGRGASNIPRGPRPSTRANPAGLTGREMKVLALVAEGRSNRDIARHLSRSLRTVEHHIAAILGKLSANTRTEAVSAAHRLGLFDPK